MSTTTRWTSADLERMPDDGNRYEIIEGELYMSKQLTSTTRMFVENSSVSSGIGIRPRDWVESCLRQG